MKIIEFYRLLDTLHLRYQNYNINNSPFFQINISDPSSSDVLFDIYTIEKVDEIHTLNIH